MGGVVQLVHVSFTPDLVAVDVVHLVDLGLTRVDVGEALTRVACGRFQPGWLNLSSFYHFFSVSMKNNLVRSIIWFMFIRYFAKNGDKLKQISD